jgi:hypothetical protein
MRINENAPRHVAHLDLPRADDRTRYGLMEARIGSEHWFEPADGVRRILPIRARAGVIEFAKQYQGRDLKLVVLEISTGRRFANVEELRAAFPDHIRMLAAREKRQWCWFGDEVDDPDDIETIKELEATIARRKKEIADLQARLPKLSMEEFDATLDKIKKQKDEIKKAETEREQKRLTIVGPLSDLLFETDLPPEPPMPRAA